MVVQNQQTVTILPEYRPSDLSEHTLCQMHPLLSLSEHTSHYIYDLCSEFMLSSLAITYLTKLGVLIQEKLELPIPRDATEFENSLSDVQQRIMEIDPELEEWVQSQFLSKIRLLCSGAIFSNRETFNGLVDVTATLMYLLRGIDEENIIENEEYILGFPRHFIDTVESSPHKFFSSIKYIEFKGLSKTGTHQGRRQMIETWTPVRGKHERAGRST